MNVLQTAARLAVLVSLACAGCAPPRRVEVITPTPTPAPTPVPTPTPSPTPIYIPQKRMETAKLYNGIELHSTLATEPGNSATTERNRAESYVLDLQLRVVVPKPNLDLAELSKINEALPTLLPGLPTLLETAKASPFFESLYRQKLSEIERSLPRLDQLLSRHNLYDCETILELQHPGTKRRALLVQADMDIDSDGSDGDRIAPIDLSSSTFQTMTSYKWAKKTKVPNPLLAGREARLKQLSDDPLLTPQGREQVRLLRAEIHQLKTYSFLIGTADPFIVLPMGLVGQSNPFSPKIGDYCVVIAGDLMLPAVVGDAGPRGKIGEASLRIGREINTRTTAENRSVSALKVTYLVFPNSGDRPWDVPDLGKWRTRCEELLMEIGGYGGVLKAWEDITKPAVTPTPSPSPSPSAAPSSSPSPSASPEASASPTASGTNGK